MPYRRSRILRPAAALLSLVFLILSLTAWIAGTRSEHSFERRAVSGGGSGIAYAAIFIGGGRVGASFDEYNAPVLANAPDGIDYSTDTSQYALFNVWNYGLDHDDGFFSILGLSLRRGVGPVGIYQSAHRWRRVDIPCSLLTIIFALSTLLLFRATHRDRLTRRRAARNQCLHCGYDLRASSDRCPECGTPVTQKQNEPQMNTDQHR